MDASPESYLNPGRYLGFAGRAGRTEWWFVHAICGVAFSINNTLLIEPSRPTIAGIPIHNGLVIGLIVYIILMWISACSIVRRLRDRNKSAWWALLYPWPLVGWAWLIIECGFLAGRTPPPEELEEWDETGTVRRSRRRPWTPARIARTAGNAIGLTLLALFLYKWFIEPPGPLPVFENTFETPGKPTLAE